MDISDALNVFKNEEVKSGSYAIDSSFFDLPLNEMMTILKKGYHLFSYDLYVLVSALHGCGSVKINKRIKALRSISRRDQSEYEDNLFEGMDIALIKISRHSNVFSGVVPSPLVVISMDNGKTWTGMIKARCRTATIETWANIYYTGVLNEISFKPSSNFFLYDFRIIGIFTAGKNSFLLSSELCMDERSIDTIKRVCMAKFNSIPYYRIVGSGEKEPLHAPPLLPPPPPPKRYPPREQQRRENTASPRKSPKRLFDVLDEPLDIERPIKKQRKE